MTRNILIATGLLAITSATQADISGFGGSGVGWTLNGHDFFNNPTPAAVSGDVLEITDVTGYYQYRSAFYSTPQNIGSFTATFTYQDLTTNNPGDGIVFTIQNQGPTVVGSALGYSGISQASGIAFQIYGNPPPGTGYDVPVLIFVTGKIWPVLQPQSSYKR